MIWETASAQSLGGRSNQEDSFAILEGRGKALILAVADGAGGHADGEKASQAAIDCLRGAAAGAPQEARLAARWLGDAIAAANQAVAALGAGPSAPRTTLAVVAIDGVDALAGHMGDSRIYQFRNGKEAFRSRDHSIVQVLLDMGRIREDELRTHPDRSRLTKALGGGDGHEPDISQLSVRPGDAFALCSDGVWEHVETGEIEQAVRAKDLKRAAQALVATAVERGGGKADNATLILARATSA